eukprot:6211222-Pleurochrysis_carterae.AAC.2
MVYPPGVRLHHRVHLVDVAELTSGCCELSNKRLLADAAACLWQIGAPGLQIAPTLDLSATARRATIRTLQY